MKNFRFLRIFRYSIIMTVASSMTWAHPSNADEFTLATVALDSIADSVSRTITGSDYTTYQAQRLKLRFGERFDPLLHGVVSRNAICGDGSTAEAWLNLSCTLQKVRPRAEYCADFDFKKGYCIAFQFSEFLINDPKLLDALERSVSNLGKDSPTENYLKNKFGVANLHAPGLFLAPMARASAKSTIEKSGRTIRVKRVSDSVFLFTVARS